MEIIGYETNCETGEVTPIHMTQEIAAKLEKIAKEEADLVAKEQADATAKAALLQKLGITADEAKLLLG